MDSPTSSNETLLDEARWPRMFARLRGGGWGRSLGQTCGCRGCAPCQRSARRYVRGLMRMSPQRARDLGWRLIFARDAVPRVVDLEPVRPSMPTDDAGDEPLSPVEGADIADSPEPLDEIRGPFHVRIRWTQTPVPLSHVEAHPWRGGVYLLVNDAEAVLKAGEGNFASRAKVYQGPRYQLRQPNALLRPTKMYLGTLSDMGEGWSRDYKQLVLTTERVLSRTVARLQRSGKIALPDANALPVPLEGAPANIKPSDVLGKVVVDNALPSRLVPDLRAAYGPGGDYPSDASMRSLVLTRKQSQWEA